MSSTSYIMRANADDVNREEEFKNGRISIGWPAGQSLIGMSRSEISALFSSRYHHPVSEVALSMIEGFLHMEKGSIIVSPSIKDKTLVHILRTISLCQYEVAREIDGNPHFIEAEFLETLPRKSLPDEVLYSLSGARKTLSKIGKCHNILKKFIDSGFFIPKKSIGSGENAQESALKVLEALLKSKDENIRLSAAQTIINSTK